MNARKIQYRLQGIAPDGTYDVTARIIDQTTLDGQPLDSPAELATDASGSGLQSSFSNTGSAGSQSPSASGQSTTSNPGQGGLLPGGLPITLPWKTAPNWLIWAIAAAGGFLVLEVARR
jgi:hypothetical protein